MFKLISFTSLALSAIVAVNGAAFPRRNEIAARHAAIARDESSYDAAVLEPYSDYITRYWAIDCPDKHNTNYFDRCCHPMKKGETLARNRDADCNPANLPSSAVASAAPSPTPSDDGDDEGDCDGGDEETSSASSAHSATPTPSAASSAAPPPPATSSAAPPAASSAAPVNVAPEPPKEPAPTQAPSSSSAHTTKTATPTPTPKPTPTPAPAPAPAPAPGGQSHTGQATWFTQNGVAGACGKVHSDNDFIVALDQGLYGNPGQQSQYCGKSLTITNKSNGKTATATVADDCPTCEGGDGSIDMSVGLFKALTGGDLGVGVFPVEWQFSN